MYCNTPLSLLTTQVMHKYTQKLDVQTESIMIGLPNYLSKAEAYDCLRRCRRRQITVLDVRYDAILFPKKLIAK